MLVLAGLVLATCGSSGPQAGDAGLRGGAGASSTTTSALIPAGSTSSAPPTSPTVPATTRPQAILPPPTGPIPDGPVPTAPVASTPAALEGVGNAGQVVLVTAGAYGEATAGLTTWLRTADGWVQVHGRWTANVGRAGFAPPGEKREGDGRTPSGTYGFGFAFGVQPDPGVSLPYRRVTPSVVWVDDPSVPSYNLWVDGGRGEAMYVTPAYDYGAVIAYNTTRTPGLGSAIFLHVSTGGPTSGCVSLPADRLLDVLRWLDPARAPVIVMGVAG